MCVAANLVVKPGYSRVQLSLVVISRISFARKVIMQNIVASAKGALIWWHCWILGLGRKLKAYLARLFVLPGTSSLARSLVVASHCLPSELLSTTPVDDAADDVADSNCLNVDSIPLFARQVLSSSTWTFFSLLLS